MNYLKYYLQVKLQCLRVEGFGLVILEAMLQQSVVIGFHGVMVQNFL